MQLTFLPEERPVSPSPSPDSERDWQIRVATSCLPILPLLTATGPSGWSGKTCPAFYPVTADGISLPSSAGWGNSGMGGPTECLTLNTSEWNHTLGPFHNGGGVSSLSDVLEAGSVPRRYYLSAKACQGILRRAENRGKVLPPALSQALETVAQMEARPSRDA